MSRIFFNTMDICLKTGYADLHFENKSDALGAVYDFHATEFFGERWDGYILIYTQKEAKVY